MHPQSVTIELPQWLTQLTSVGLPSCGPSDAARMQFALELARSNVTHKTGGPFASIVVEESTGECVAAGVNLVVASGLSVTHAEAVAIMLAQRAAGSYDLAGEPGKRYSLYATGQPCIMCFGILWWSGITRLICGARGEDVERITRFREGPLPADWPRLLTERPGLPAIEVVRDVHRDEACAVLQAYMDAGHPIYNPGATAGD